MQYGWCCSGRKMRGEIKIQEYNNIVENYSLLYHSHLRELVENSVLPKQIIWEYIVLEILTGMWAARA